MTVIHLDEYRASHPTGTPRQICFHGARYCDENNTEKILNICVTMEDGDVAGILDTVKEDGGIGQLGDDGTYFFLPWPCATVEIRDI